MVKSVLVVLAFACLACADPIDYTECNDNHSFRMNSLDVEGCSGSNTCNIMSGHTYKVMFNGCYNGTVTPITNIPYEVKSGFAGLDFLPVDSGDLCQDFTTGSPTTACPATIPQPGEACGIWLLNVQVPIFEVPDLGLGVPSTVRAKAWANVKSGIPVFCVEFPVQYFL